MTRPDKIVNMSEFDNAYEFVEGFFAALAALGETEFGS